MPQACRPDRRCFVIRHSMQFHQVCCVLVFDRIVSPSGTLEDKLSSPTIVKLSGEMSMEVPASATWIAQPSVQRRSNKGSGEGFAASL